jgi:hypothetical protein
MTADTDRPFRKPNPPPAPAYSPDADTAFKCLTCQTWVVGDRCPRCGPQTRGRCNDGG